MHQAETNDTRVPGGESANKSSGNIGGPRGPFIELMSAQIGTCNDVLAILEAVQELLEHTERFPSFRDDDVMIARLRTLERLLFVGVSYLHRAVRKLNIAADGLYA